MNKNLELLAPAKNMECLISAFKFGADAVYLGGKSFGLRTYANNFTRDEIKYALDYAHKLKRKIYIAVNSVIYEKEINKLIDYLSFLNDYGADAVIFSDPAILEIIHTYSLNLIMHLSTQVNTLNSLSAQFWIKQGIKRIIMSREASITDIAHIASNLPLLEIECFVHGAMCMAYSGRCILSATLTNRSGNRGECAQPCRWKYSIHEKGYENDYLPIEGDSTETYILNSKDLMMINYIPELVNAGVSSFKIEGRMKSVYYVASVVHAYRKAIDRYLNKDPFDETLKYELEKSATRLFTTGFYFGMPENGGIDQYRTEKPRSYTFVGKVLKCLKDEKILVEQRNKFNAGDVLEILSPELEQKTFIVNFIYDSDGKKIESACHPQQVVIINCSFILKEGDLLRRFDG